MRNQEQAAPGSEASPLRAEELEAALPDQAYLRIDSRRQLAEALSLNRLWSASATPDVLDIACRELASLLDYAHIACAMLSASGVQLEVVAEQRDGDRPSTLGKALALPSGHDAESLHWLLRSTSLGDDGSSTHLLEWPGRLDGEAVLVLPLAVGEAVIGCIFLVAGAGHAHNPSDTAFAQRVASVVSRVVENDRIRTEMQRRMDGQARVEFELRRLQNLHQSIVISMTEGVIVEDASGYVTYANPAALALLGYRADELVGQHWTIFVPPDQQTTAEQADARRHNHQTDLYEIDVLCRDGRRLTVEVSGSPRYDTLTGDFAGSLAVFTDISQRKLADQASARRAAEFSALYETSLEINSQPDLPALLNTIVERTARLLDVPMGGLYLVEEDGTSLRLAVSYGLPQAYIGLRVQSGEGVAGRVALSGQPLVVENYRTWEGRLAVYDDEPFGRILGMPMKVRGRVVGVIMADDDKPGICDDHQLHLISLFADQAAIAVENFRLFQAEQQRAAALAEALQHQQEMDRLQQEFVQSVSHELRTPLTIVRGHAELLEDGGLGELQEEQLAAVKIIANRTRMLSELVGEVVAALEMQHRTLERQYVDVVELAGQVKAEFKVLAQGNGQLLGAEIDPACPGVQGDRLALRRVFDNLLGNALKFTPAGGQITMRVHGDDSHAILEVSDTGIGIPEGMVERVFDRFYQVETGSTRRSGGVGLGLALVKEIVEAHGGSVKASSRLGAGTTFTVVLPAQHNVSGTDDESGTRDRYGGNLY